MARVPANEVSYAEDGFYYRDRELFTGVTFTVYPTGEARSEVEYRDGHRWGPSKDWYKTGQLAEEWNFRQGGAHGMQREFEKDGTLLSEEACEHGIILWRRELQAGEMVETYRLSEEEHNHALLLKFRKLFSLDPDVGAE